MIFFPLATALLNYAIQYNIGNIFLRFIWAVVFFILLVVVLIGFFAVQARRWHDLGKSGWFSVLHLIPIIGQILTIILFFIPGDSKKNKYGEKPISIRF